MTMQRPFSNFVTTLFGSPDHSGRLGNADNFGYDYDYEAPNKGIENIVDDPILYRRTIRLLDWRRACAEHGVKAEDVRHIENLVDWPHGNPLPPVSRHNVCGVPPYFYEGSVADETAIENYVVMLLDDYLLNLRKNPESVMERNRLEKNLFTRLGVTVEDFRGGFETDEEERTEAIEKYLANIEEQHAFYDLDNNYIGMDFLKEVILDVRAAFNASADDDEKPSMHMALKAGPGEGKSDSPELIAKAFHNFGLLSRGHVVKISLSEIAGNTHGADETAVQEAFEKAKGGVLFFDECDTAGTYRSANQKRSSVSQAINLLMDKMRNDICVIVATYPENMDLFLDSDDGLRSRFADRVLQFPEKSTETYVKMLELKLSKAGFVLADDNVRSAVWQHFSDTRKKLGKTFVNGRVVRELAQSIKATIIRKDAEAQYGPTYVTVNDIVQTIERGQKRAEPKTIDIHAEVNPYRRLLPHGSGAEADAEKKPTVVSLDSFRKPGGPKPGQ